MCIFGHIPHSWYMKCIHLEFGIQHSSPVSRKKGIPSGSHYTFPYDERWFNLDTTQVGSYLCSLSVRFRLKKDYTKVWQVRTGILHFFIWKSKWFFKIMIPLLTNSPPTHTQVTTKRAAFSSSISNSPHYGLPERGKVVIPPLHSVDIYIYIHEANINYSRYYY